MLVLFWPCWQFGNAFHAIFILADSAEFVSWKKIIEMKIKVDRENVYNWKFLKKICREISLLTCLPLNLVKIISFGLKMRNAVIFYVYY